RRVGLTSLARVGDLVVHDPVAVVVDSVADVLRRAGPGPVTNAATGRLGSTFETLTAVSRGVAGEPLRVWIDARPAGRKERRVENGQKSQRAVSEKHRPTFPHRRETSSGHRF